MTYAELHALAQKTLTSDEFTVWLAKHRDGLGRRAGSLTLGITEETFRHRLATATRKLDTAIAARKDAA